MSTPLQSLKLLFDTFRSSGHGISFIRSGPGSGHSTATRPRDDDFLFIGRSLHTLLHACRIVTQPGFQYSKAHFLRLPLGFLVNVVISMFITKNATRLRTLEDLEGRDGCLVSGKIQSRPGAFAGRVRQEYKKNTFE